MIEAIKPRRASKPQSEETRAKIAAANRDAAANRGLCAWDAQRVARLRAAYKAGGAKAAVEAFPDLRDRQVRSAVRRYCLLDHVEYGGSIRGSHSVWNDPDFVRRFYEALTQRSY